MLSRIPQQYFQNWEQPPPHREGQPGREGEDLQKSKKLQLLLMTEEDDKKEFKGKKKSNRRPITLRQKQ